PDSTMPDVECGPGTTEVDGVCEPNEACGPGTTANAMGECVPDSMIVCGDGTIDDGMGNCIVESPLVCGDGSIDDGNGNCVIDPDRIVTCDAGLVLVMNACVTRADALGMMMPQLSMEQDDWRYLDEMGNAIGTANDVTLPMAGDSIVLQGVIDVPVDINGDDFLDQDFDWFAFTATAGTVLELSIVNDGMPSPQFVVFNQDENSEWLGRQSATNQTSEPARQVVI